MVGRRVKSGKTTAVRIVISKPTRNSSARTHKNVTLRPQPTGRIRQSVFKSAAENPSDELANKIPGLLEIIDDEDKDNNLQDLARTMEQEFFGCKTGDVPQEEDEKVKKDPVCQL
jgi:hypothetical protein